MKIKIEGCLSTIVLVFMLAFGLFITYIVALGMVTFVDKIAGNKRAKEKIIIVDSTAAKIMFENNWDKKVPLTDDAI